MEFNYRALSDFAKLSDANTLTFATTVGTNMTGNRHFTNIPEVVTLVGITAEYSDLLSRSKSGNREIIAEKNQTKKEVVRLLRVIVRAVNEQALGNKPALESSGFNVSVPPAHKPVGMPTLKLENGLNQGTLAAEAKDGGAGKAWIFEACLTNTFESGVIRLESLQRKVVITGLLRFREYFVRVTAIGTKNQRVTSAVVSRGTL